LIVPIVFNIFKDSDAFYLQIGDGTLCTIASLPSVDIPGFVEQLNKILGWSQQCIDEKINVTKDAGFIGTVRLEFISNNNAENIFVWLTAEGNIAEDRLIKKQTVKLNMLNICTLMSHMTKAKELYDHREEARHNADKLK